MQVSRRSLFLTLSLFVCGGSRTTTRALLTALPATTLLLRNEKIIIRPHNHLGFYRRWLSFPEPSNVLLQAKPKRGSVVDSYQTVSVNCAKCGERLFRYKKKNGTKSNLVKCYMERISEDCAGLLLEYEENGEGKQKDDFEWCCPTCKTQFARNSLIHGRPALKIVGGKVRMSKK